MIKIRKCDYWTGGKPQYRSKDYHEYHRSGPFYDRFYGPRWRWYCDVHGVSGSGKTFEIARGRAFQHVRKLHYMTNSVTININL